MILNVIYEVIKMFNNKDMEHKDITKYAIPYNIPLEFHKIVLSVEI